MGGNQAFGRAHCSDLRSAYRAAFSRWSEETALLRAFEADPHVSSALLQNASSRSRLAEIAYRDSRDALWQCMKG